MLGHSQVLRFPAGANEGSVGEDIQAALGVSTIDIHTPSPGSLIASVPIATPEQLYYRRTEDHWMLSTDPRALINSEDALDLTAIRSLMQFGAIVPPNTSHLPVKRLVAGRISAMDSASTNVSDQGPVSSWGRVERQSGSPKARLTAAIDAVLEESCPDRNPIVLFSGGVDSGVIAARIASMGWSDALLLNYAMDEDDIQSQYAERVARQLGLRFERIVRQSEFGDTFLQRIGESYRQPFCDISCIPTMELADAAIARASPGQPIVDGTGADGAFGLFSKSQQWSRIHRIPRVLRSVAGDAYSRLGFGTRVGRPEYVLRLIARTLHESPAVAAVAQASLRSEFFTSGGDPACSSTRLRAWLEDTIGRDKAEIHLASLDLSLVCADRYAQKNKWIFDVAGSQVIYPFLGRSIIAMALTEALDWPDATTPKSTLKEILADSVSSELVYRPKAGFRPPIIDYLRRDAFAQALTRLVEEPGALEGLVNTRAIDAAARLLAQGSELPPTTISIVWTAMVTSLWLRQINGIA